jgi:hypothetical protein
MHFKYHTTLHFDDVSLTQLPRSPQTQYNNCELRYLQLNTQLAEINKNETERQTAVWDEGCDTKNN